METIQLKQDGIIKIGILDSDGNDTGNFLEFDLEDLELPYRLCECEKLHEKNRMALKAKMITINKKQDVPDGLLTRNEKEKIKALKEYYEDEEKALDLFLGNGGTKKILNGRKPYYTMYDDINEYLEPILPKLKVSMDNIENKIKSKYQLEKIEDDSILKVDDNNE